MNDQVPYQTLEIKRLENRIIALEAQLAERGTANEPDEGLQANQAEALETAANRMSEDSGMPAPHRKTQIPPYF